MTGAVTPPATARTRVVFWAYGGAVALALVLIAAAQATRSRARARLEVAP
jgi:hypothetical protein